LPISTLLSFFTVDANFYTRVAAFDLTTIIIVRYQNHVTDFAFQFSICIDFLKMSDVHSVTKKFVLIFVNFQMLKK